MVEDCHPQSYKLSQIVKHRGNTIQRRVSYKPNASAKSPPLSRASIEAQQDLRTYPRLWQRWIEGPSPSLKLHSGPRLDWLRIFDMGFSPSPAQSWIGWPLKRFLRASGPAPMLPVLFPVHDPTGNRVTVIPCVPKLEEDPCSRLPKLRYSEVCPVRTPIESLRSQICSAALVSRSSKLGFGMRLRVQSIRLAAVQAPNPLVNVAPYRDLTPSHQCFCGCELVAVET